MPLLDDLAHRRLLVVSGKGGVGKSAMAAALSRLLAAAGRSVVLLELDPRESQHQLLGTPPSAGEFVDAGDGLAGDLFVQNLEPSAVIEQVVRERLKLKAVGDRVIRSPVFRPFVEGAPGLQPMGALAHALRLLRGEAGRRAPRPDVVVLDAPATGHGVSLLEAPGRVSEVIRDGPFGRLAAELAEFVADEAACAVVVVTLAEEMPVAETLELDAVLRERFGRPPAVVVVNGLYPKPAKRGAAGGRLRDLWLERRAVNERELERLRSGWRGPTVELPLLPLDRGPELVAALGQSLAAGLEECT